MHNELRLTDDRNLNKAFICSREVLFVTHLSPVEFVIFFVLARPFLILLLLLVIIIIVLFQVFSSGQPCCCCQFIVIAKVLSAAQPTTKRFLSSSFFWGDGGSAGISCRRRHRRPCVRPPNSPPLGPDSIGKKILLKNLLKICQKVITENSRNVKKSEVGTCLLFKLGFQEYFFQGFQRPWS